MEIRPYVAPISAAILSARGGIVWRAFFFISFNSASVKGSASEAALFESTRARASKTQSIFSKRNCSALFFVQKSGARRTMVPSLFMLIPTVFRRDFMKVYSRSMIKSLPLFPLGKKPRQVIKHRGLIILPDPKASFRRAHQIPLYLILLPYGNHQNGFKAATLEGLFKDRRIL